MIDAPKPQPLRPPVKPWTIDRAPDEHLIDIATTCSNRGVALAAEVALRKRYPSKRAARAVRPKEQG